MLNMLFVRHLPAYLKPMEADIMKKIEIFYYKQHCGTRMHRIV